MARNKRPQLIPNSRSFCLARNKYLAFPFYTQDSCEVYSGEIRFRHKDSFNKLVQQLFKLSKIYAADVGINRAYMVLVFMQFIIKRSLQLLRLLLLIEVFTNCSGWGGKQSYPKHLAIN